MKKYKISEIVRRMIAGILCLPHLVSHLAAQHTSCLNLEESTNLQNWQSVPVTPGMIDANGKLQLPSATPERFYRLQVEMLTPAGISAAEFALIPAGNFQMGDNFAEGSTGERPVHTVNVDAFYMGKYEVTKVLWDSVRTYGAANGYTDLPTGGGKCANHPVHSISWYDMVKWCNARSQRDGLTPCYSVSGVAYKTGVSNAVECDWNAGGYRLPTEAEWEKAARGGLSGKRFPWGDTISHSQANYYSSTSYAYDVSPTRDYHPSYAYATGSPYSSPVGSFAPNGYGLYDMAGNMWEWVWDWGESGYYERSPSANPRGASSGSYRLYRGGYWGNFGAYGCRVAARREVSPGDSNLSFGFRIARISVP